MDGTTLIVGARSDDVGANDDQGSARISFPLPRCPPAGMAATTTATARSTSPTIPGASRSTNQRGRSPARRDPDPDTDSDSDSDRTPGGPLAGPFGIPPAAVDDGSQAPRIVRPRTQPPVTPTKARQIKFATVWSCVDQPDDAPCKAYARVTIAYVVNDRRAVAARTKRLRIASSRVTVPSGAKRPVTAKLTKQGYKLLRRRGKLKARVEMELSRAGEETARASVAVTIKARKPR